MPRSRLLSRILVWPEVPIRGGLRACFLIRKRSSLEAIRPQWLLTEIDRNLDFIRLLDRLHVLNRLWRNEPVNVVIPCGCGSQCETRKTDNDGPDVLVHGAYYSLGYSFERPATSGSGVTFSGKFCVDPLFANGLE